MIQFITKKDYSHLKDHLELSNNFNELKSFLLDLKEVAYDKELNHLDPFFAVPLLTQFGNKEKQFVVDDTSMDISELQGDIRHLTLIGHNIKFDYKMSKHLQNFHFR